jgi:UDP-glucose 4-epimerase
MSSPTVLLTGASGFVGGALQARFPGCEPLSLGRDDWQEAIRAATFRDRVVVHLAGLARPTGSDESALERANVDKTVALAKAAATGGATRFVFLSTIKVHGDASGERPFGPETQAAPADAYARSKWLAEQALRDVAQAAGMPWVILRAPLVYGRGARGNFRALVRLADTPLWLPFANVRNRRSLVHVRDLADALYLSATHPGAPGRAFPVAHPEPTSTPGLVAALRACLGRPARLFPLPALLLEGLGRIAGRRDQVLRLTRSLEVDPSLLIDTLGWVPRYGLNEGLREALQ